MVTKFLNVSTDPKLSSNSNILVPSEKAVRTFIASKSIQLDYLQASSPDTYSSGQKWLNTSDKKIYTAVSSSDWGTGESIEIDQFFTFKDLLYYYDGTNINAYSTLTITEQNQERKLKTWLGTRADYEALNGVYDSNTIYQVIETGSDYATLATQSEYNNSSSIKAATPYQVKQDLGNYLSLVNGGNLAASKTIGLTNSNNEVAYLGYNTSAEITVSQGLNVTNTLNANNIVARSGNIYKTNTSGATAVWSDNLASSANFGIVKVDGTTISANNGVISSLNSTFANFNALNVSVALGSAAIAGTYTLSDIPNDNFVHLALFSCYLSTTQSGQSSLNLKTDLMSNACAVTCTNNAFASAGTVLLPVKQTVTISFDMISGGIGPDCSVTLLGYF